MTYAAWAFADQASAERTLAKSRADRPSRTAAFQFARRGGFQINTQVVETARARESRLQGGIKNAFAFFQKLFGVLHRQALQKVLGGNGCPGRKQTMNMKR